MKNYTVWAEGYAATGESSTAFLLGTYFAESFDEAVYKCIIANSKESKLFSHNSDGTWSYWGCRLFGNESDARRSFG